MNSFLSQVAEHTQDRVQYYPLPSEPQLGRRRNSLTESLLFQPGVIAELKRRSPSLGSIAPNLDIVQTALNFAQAGASALSVLTEPEHFGGSFADLAAVRRAVPHLPILMKDFVQSERHLKIAACLGADAVLLIKAHLSLERLQSLRLSARHLGLESLVEIHSQEELEEILPLTMDPHFPLGLVGINNRDLKTLKVDLNTVSSLLPQIPKSVVAVAESGLSHPEQVRKLRVLGARGFLVGTALTSAADPKSALTQMLGGL